MNAHEIREAMREGQLRTARARFLLDTVPGQIDNELERRGFELLSATEVLRGLGGEVRWRGAFRVPAAPQSTPEALAFNLGVVYTDMLRLHDVKWGKRTTRRVGASPVTTQRP